MKKIYYKYQEIINYVIIGALTTFVSISTYYILTNTLFNPNITIQLQISNIISWILSVIFAYFANRKYVFNKKNKSNIKEFFSFCLSRITTLLLDMLIMYVFVSYLQFNDKIIKIISQIIIIVLNYLLSKFLVFKKEE